MSAIKRDLRAWLARLEIRASTSHWADRHAAHHRKTRRAVVEICEAIRKQLLLIGLDPELAVSLQRGEAAAELAAIPDSEALRAADEAITRGDQNDDGEALGIPMAQIQRMAKHFCDGSQPDLANASLAQLFAFCFAIDETP